MGERRKNVSALSLQKRKLRPRNNGQPESLGHLCQERGLHVAPAPQPAPTLPTWLGPPSRCMGSTRLSRWALSMCTFQDTSMLVTLPYCRTDT